MGQKQGGAAWPECVALVGVAGFVAVMIRGWPIVGGDFWTALGALGSAAAAIGAIAVAAWGWRQRLRDRRRDVVGYAAIARGRIRSAIADLFQASHSEQAMAVHVLATGDRSGSSEVLRRIEDELNSLDYGRLDEIAGGVSNQLNLALILLSWSRLNGRDEWPRRTIHIGYLGQATEALQMAAEMLGTQRDA